MPAGDEGERRLDCRAPQRRAPSSIPVPPLARMSRIDTVSPASAGIAASPNSPPSRRANASRESGSPWMQNTWIGGGVSAATQSTSSER